MKKKQTQKNKKGFTLVESLVSVFVFSLASVMIAGTFTSFFKNFQIAKKTQQSTESAQYAMNLMAKTIRTSEIHDVYNGSPLIYIRMYDKSSQQCVAYRYAATRKGVIHNSVPAATIGDCDWAGLIDGSSMTNLSGLDDIVGARFNYSPGSNGVGFVTVALDVQGSNAVSPIQMTVSLRE